MHSESGIAEGSHPGRVSDAGAAELRGALPFAWAFLALVVLCSGLIVLGALVRAHGAGLACPDWPLCFGDFVPSMDMRVAFEWSHRLVAGSVAWIFLALAVGLWRRPRLFAELRGLLGLAATLLGVQIMLGALTVWLQLAAWTVTAHLVTGNSFNACLLLLAAKLRELPSPPLRTGLRAGLRGSVLGAASLLGLQLILGGLVAARYAGLACTQWPACLDGVWFPSLHGAMLLHLAHRWNAPLLLAALALVAWQSRGTRLAPAALLALLLGGLQMLVGIANVLLGIPVEVTGLHSALAAMLVLVMAWSGREVLAPLTPR